MTATLNPSRLTTIAVGIVVATILLLLSLSEASARQSGRGVERVTLIEGLPDIRQTGN